MIIIWSLLFRVYIYIYERALVEDCINQIKAKRKKKADNVPGPIGNKALQASIDDDNSMKR
jgi:hypothetical protein